MMYAFSSFSPNSPVFNLLPTRFSHLPPFLPSTVSHHPYLIPFFSSPRRHLYGIVACTLLIYSKVLYFSIETVPGTKNFQFTADPGGTVSLIVLDIIIGKLRASQSL